MRNDHPSRHHRQTILREIGVHGQKCLQSASVLCVGVGGLGCPALLYLAAAGFGRIGLVDSDTVDITNLHRQILFKTRDQGRLKVDAAKEYLLDLDPNISIETYPERLTIDNAIQILKPYDVIIDGTDNFATKLLINDFAAQLGIPVVFGSVTGFEARISVFWAKHGPCYRCLYPKPPVTRISNCAESGIVGALTGAAGSIQAMEAIKLVIAKQGSQDFLPLIGRLLIMDLGCAQMSSVQIPRVKNCPGCATTPEKEQISLQDYYEDTCNTVTGAQVIPDISAIELKNIIATSSDLELIDVREENEFETGHIPQSRNVPLSTLQDEQIPSVNFGRHLVLYCQSGIRSKKAATLLLSRGATRISSLRGGLNAWAGALISKSEATPTDL